MPFNRIGCFYVGGFAGLESQAMSIDDQNNELNDVLDSRLNQLNAAIDAHEKALKGMKIPRDVYHCYFTEEDEDDDGNVVAYYYHNLGMVKYQSTWRLCYGVEDSSRPDLGANWKPLVDCSIPERLRAVPHLDELRQKIVEAKKKLVPELETAIERLVKSLDAFEERPKTKGT